MKWPLRGFLLQDISIYLRGLVILILNLLGILQQESFELRRTTTRGMLEFTPQGTSLLKVYYRISFDPLILFSVLELGSFRNEIYLLIFHFNEMTLIALDLPFPSFAYS